jgi:branched-chain amino acid transport system substrate-binding protein
MRTSRRRLLVTVLLILVPVVAAGFTVASAQDRPIRIGVMNDLSSVYADFQGRGSVIAAQMAVADYGGKAAGRRVEVLSADHQNKADVGSAVAARWMDIDGVDVVADVPNSSVALAVNELVRAKNRTLLVSGGGTALLTGEKCSPNTVHWTYDTWEVGHSVARAALSRGKTWFFITADYAFGHDLEKQATEEIVKGGGKVLGTVRHPIGVSDFSSLLVQAQSSGAQIIGFANAGGDMTNSLKQAAEFGLFPKQTAVGLIFGLNNVPPLGLQAVQGLLLQASYYWDMNAPSRTWARRFQEAHPNKNMPNDMQAGVYASVLHYLKAVDKVGGTSDGKAVVAAMKAMPTDDALFGKGRIREDGRKVHPVYLFEVKRPDESKGAWDYFKVVTSIPAEQAFRPLSEGGCPLVGAK